MAELITIKQTKCLIGYIGDSAIIAYEKVYIDAMHMNDEGYVMSDYYDLVQDVALFLCEHFGKYLDDFLYTSKKGKEVTIKTECYYIIKRELYKRYYVNANIVSNRKGRPRAFFHVVALKLFIKSNLISYIERIFSVSVPFYIALFSQLFQRVLYRCFADTRTQFHQIRFRKLSDFLHDCASNRF